MELNKKIRCFISLDLPAALIQDLISIQENLADKGFFVGKYTEPSNIHLTLKFLGDIQPEQVLHVAELLSKIKFEPFSLNITKLGVFSRNQIRIIWIKAEGAEALQNRIDNSLEEIFPIEDRFMGHITIARVKKTINKPELLNYLDNYIIEPTETSISEFKLKQSILTSAGPFYKTIEKFDFFSPS